MALSLLRKWRTSLTLAGKAGTRSGGFKRLVVKVVDVLKGASFVPYDTAPPSAQDGQRRVSVEGVKKGDDGCVLWDLAHVRLASDHRAFEATPLPGGGADPGAYQDEFFETERPPQAVYGNGENTAV